MTRRPEILALIPARGGSKSIPRKNLLPIAGKPLIAHTIAHALSSTLITRVVVSTDDDEIAVAARAHGAEVPFLRPDEIAQDHSPDVDAFRHALQWLRANEGYECELVVHLRPTGPVRRVERIDEAIETILHQPEADSLRSVTPASQTPYKMWRLENGVMVPVMQMDGIELQSQPRQGLPQVLWQNGYVDVIRPRVILEDGLMAGRRVLPFIMTEPTYELDYPENIARVEAALSAIELERPESHPARHAV